jgi:UTP--glucose-1-phosphate uridylyltransferase
MIRKAVIPAAGMGTRFLPVTKSQPKEMLPIVDTPVIQYVVEEAVASGLSDILMIIGRGKRAIEEHFDRNLELEAELEAQEKQAELDAIRRISGLARIHFVWQRELNGLGDAVACAREHVGDEPFAVLLGDTLLASATPVTGQLMQIHDRYRESVVALEEVPPDRVGRYGIVDAQPVTGDVVLIHSIIEKPGVAEAPSNLAVAGRYVFTAELFDYLSDIPPGKNNEIQLADAMAMMLGDHAMYGLRFKGERYDIGNRLDFIRTNIIYGLQRPELAAELKDFLAEVVRGFDEQPAPPPTRRPTRVTG